LAKGLVDIRNCFLSNKGLVYTRNYVQTKKYAPGKDLEYMNMQVERQVERQVEGQVEVCTL
jgi:hypothetical protein